MKKPNGFKETEWLNQKPKKPEEDKEVEEDNEEDNDNNNKDVVGDSCVDGLQKVIDFYNNNVGAITPYGLEIMQDYLKEFDTDVIIYAMQISVEANKRTIQYIKAILNNWSKAGVKTLIEAQNESKKKVLHTNKKDTGFAGRDYDNFDFNVLLANKNIIEGE